MNTRSRRRSLLLEPAILLTLLLTTWAADDMIPYFTKEPVSSVISPGAAVTLPCRVHPPSSVVRWKMDNLFIDDDNTYGLNVVGTDLVIPDLPSEGGDSHLFQCSVQTSQGTIFSKPARISKAVLRKFEQREDLHLNVTEGANIVLPCQPPYSRPSAEVMFRVNKTVIISANSSNTDHHRILPSGNLQIINISFSDEGRYQCMAYNALRNQTRIAKHIIHLRVLNTIVPSQEPAVIMPTIKVEAVVGQDVMLECSAVGNPQPVISWEKYGGKLIQERSNLQYGNLFLEKVTREDEGTYLCKADNGLNSLMVDGLKVMLLEISEPPAVIPVRQFINASLGHTAELECVVTGRPKPHIIWFHNGRYLKSQNGGDRLTIKRIDVSHQGLYQCFAKNDAGVSDAIMYMNVVQTSHDAGSFPLADQNITNIPISGNSVEIDKDTPAGQESSRQRHKAKNRRKKKGRRKGKTKKDFNKLTLVPPEKPEVKQLSDTSVMLNWTVPENEGLRITFFRVQYKKVAPKKGPWKTEDVEIASHTRMYEVRGLKPRATYKFRIAAVYSNNDNKHGPNSDRFEMQADPQPETKPPAAKPKIVEVLPIDYQNVQGLNVRWQYNTITSSPIEGFFIYYRPYHKDDEPFQNSTLVEPSVRAHLLTKLSPSTEYLIKMQSFNSAGKSPFSNEVVERTKGPIGRYPILPPNVGKDVNGEPDSGKAIQPVSPTKKYEGGGSNDATTTSNQSNSETLYMILGSVLGVMMLLLIIFMFMCWWKQRQQRRMMDAMNDAVRNKFQDSSQRIYADSMRKKLVNGGLAMNGINGTIANGHIPRNFHKMNINVNPLSEMDSLNSTDGSNHFTPTTFHPNGSLPGHHRASDNNCNNINQSKSLENSLQRTNHVTPSSPPTGDSGHSVGGGESLAYPPSPVCNGVLVGHNSDSQEQNSINQSREQTSGEQTSGDPCDSSLSYDDTGGVTNHNAGRHRKRRKRLLGTEQPTKDQATNTDLSSNEGTMDLAAVNKSISSSQESGQSVGDAAQTNNSDNLLFVPNYSAV